MKTQNAIFGRSRKSFGSATAYTMNGQNIVRTKPIAVANPRTDAQTSQRVRFNAFTKTANGVSDSVLEALIPIKEIGRNRRTTLQAQLAPAYGAQANSDPTAAERFVPTFDVEKLGDIGTGELGYIGDLATATISNGSANLTQQAARAMLANVVNTNDEDKMAMVYISEDGCVLNIRDIDQTFGTLRANAESGDLSWNGFNDLSGHGSSIKAWVVKKKERLQLIGLGTFSVAKRNARDRHNVVPS